MMYMQATGNEARFVDSYLSGMSGKMRDTVRDNCTTYMPLCVTLMPQACSIHMAYMHI